MSSIHCLLASFFFFFLVQAHAYESIGKVIKLKGNVSQLRPGEMQARKIAVNEDVLEDTSLLTGKRSMVVVRMNDRSIVTLGPESKMVMVDAPTQKDPGIISLLNGHLRSQVTKQTRSGSKEHKQIISTRSAALGVRGTDFILVHNSSNHVSSLVTLEGSVEMAKIDEAYVEALEKSLAQKRETLEIERYSNDSIEYRRLAPQRLRYSERIKMALRKAPKIVEAGHFSGSVESLNIISEPTRISPKQFAALYKNTELEVQENFEIEDLKDSESLTLPRGVQYAQSSTPSLGYLDLESKKYAPKAGGFLDLKTSLYVAPDKQAVFDERYQVFEPQITSGGVNPRTGEYIPPKGLVLDEKKGFIVDQRVQKSSQKEQLQTEVEKLNRQASSQMVMKKSEKDVAQEMQVLSSRELMTKNHLKFSLGFFTQDLNYDAGSRRSSFSSTDALRFDLMMSHSSGRSWQILTGLSYKKINFEENFLRQDDRNLFGVQLGARRYLNSRLQAVGLVALEQDHFIEELENAEESLSVVNSTRLTLGLEWEPIKSNRWSLHLDGFISPIFAKTTRDLETEMALGLELRPYFNYWMSQNSALEFGARFQSISQEQSNPLSDATLDRDDSGLFLTYKRVF